MQKVYAKCKLTEPWSNQGIAPAIRSYKELRLKSQLAEPRELARNISQPGDHLTPLQSCLYPVGVEGRDVCAYTLDEGRAWEVDVKDKTRTFVLPAALGMFAVPNTNSNPAPRALIVCATEEACAAIFEEACQMTQNTTLTTFTIPRHPNQVIPCDLLVATVDSLKRYSRIVGVDLSCVQHLMLDQINADTMTKHRSFLAGLCRREGQRPKQIFVFCSCERFNSGTRLHRSEKKKLYDLERLWLHNPVIVTIKAQIKTVKRKRAAEEAVEEEEIEEEAVEEEEIEEGEIVEGAQGAVQGPLRVQGAIQGSTLTHHSLAGNINARVDVVTSGLRQLLDSGMSTAEGLAVQGTSLALGLAGRSARGAVGAAEGVLSRAGDWAFRKGAGNRE